MYPDSPLFISPYNIISKMPRSHIYPLPAFLQCGKHSKHGSIFDLSLPELSLNCENFYTKAPHDLNAILTNLGGEYLVSRVFSADAISEVSQYNFNMKKMTVVPKHVKLPNSDKKSKGILGLDSILSPSTVNLYPIQDIIEIGSVASGQARSKIRKSSLKEKSVSPKKWSPLKKKNIINQLPQRQLQPKILQIIP